MFWILFVSWIALIACTLAVAYWVEYHSELGMVAVLFIGVIVAYFLAMFSYNTALDYQHSKCANWGESAMLETKYVNVGYGDWACWAKVDGRWLPIEQVRSVQGVGMTETEKDAWCAYVKENWAGNLLAGYATIVTYEEAKHNANRWIQPSV